MLTIIMSAIAILFVLYLAYATIRLVFELMIELAVPFAIVAIIAFVLGALLF